MDSNAPLSQAESRNNTCIRHVFIDRYCIDQLMIRIISEIVAKYTVPVLIDRRIQSTGIELGPSKVYSVRLLYNSDVEIGGGIGKCIVQDKNEHPIYSSYTSFY